eukprot:Amastigsp_a681899_6.p3 type:complete len:123 gc:universal Amastigsp_a681899_6:542-910(+)
MGLSISKTFQSSPLSKSRAAMRFRAPRARSPVQATNSTRGNRGDRATSTGSGKQLCSAAKNGCGPAHSGWISSGSGGGRANGTNSWAEERKPAAVDARLMTAHSDEEKDKHFAKQTKQIKAK